MKMKNRFYSRTSVLLFAGLFAAVSTTAVAAPANIKEGKATSQPIGHYEFCQKYKAECEVTSRNLKPTKLTRPRWREMVEANAYANTQIKPITDLEYFGVNELWDFPQSHGDCEDFVLLKRHMLMKKGWPASSLLITVVKQPNGDGHAVLTVRTDRGDYILDNLSDKIEIWHKTDYKFLKRQMPKHSGRWQNVFDQRNRVGSISN